MKKLILFLTIFLLLIQIKTEAQPKVSPSIGRKVNIYTKVDVPSIYKERSLLQKTSSINIQLVESTEHPLPADVEFAMDKAIDIWSYLIDSGQNITIFAEWKDMGWDAENDQGTLAACGPTSFVKNFSGAPFANTQYPIALAEAISNSNLNGAEYEINVFINSNINIDWYTGTDGIPQENKFDLVTTLLHEIAHGLGFFDSFDHSNGLGSYGEPFDFFEGFPTIYDQYSVVGSAHPSVDKLISYAQSSEELAAKLTSKNIYFDGHTAYLSNNSSSAKLFAPAVWEQGSSMAHLDEDVFPSNNRNSLMTPYTDMAEVVHSPGEVGLALLGDLGWNVNRLMTMIHPNNESTLAKGSNVIIKWAENLGGNVNLELYRIESGISTYVKTINQNAIFSNKGENNYSWLIPSAPTDVPVGEYRIQFTSMGEGISISEIFNVSDQPQVAIPDITPKSGTYASTQTVTITCSTPGAQIYYTTNGTEPTTSSNLYSGVPFNATPPVTIKAKAFKSGYAASETSVEVYQHVPNGVAISQLDKNGISFGQVAIWAIWDAWNHFNSGTVTLRHSTMTLKALQDYKPGTNEKFNFWTDNQDRTFPKNWESINTSSSTKEIKARFFETKSITVQNALEGFTSINDGSISFKDPWKKDDFSDQAKGVRNRGSSALMNSHSSPLGITTGGEFMGVLLDQVQSSGTYYSARALNTQQINGTNAFFVNWTSTSADVPSPNSLETPIVFRQADAVVKANYKGTNLTGNSNAFTNSSQQKAVKTSNGRLHLVYESLNNVWYERSTDNGATWEIMNSGNPLGISDSKHPAIDSYGNQVAIVWQEKNGSGWKLNTAVFDNGIKKVESTLETGTDWSFNTTPAIAWDYNAKAVIGYRDYNYFGNLSICYRVGSLSTFNITWHGTEGYISNSSSTSYNPTIAAIESFNDPVKFHVAWETQFTVNSRHIEYQRIDVASDGSASVNGANYKEISVYSYGTHYGPYPTNEHASIDVNTNGEVQLVWVGKRSSEAKVMKRTLSSSGIWGSSFTYFDFYYVLYSPNVRYASDGDYVIAWGRNNGFEGNKYWNSSSQTISSTNKQGRDIQLLSSVSSTQVNAIVLNTSVLPHTFSTTTNVLSKSTKDQTQKSREAVVVGNGYSYKLSIGEMLLDEEPISFIEIEDTAALKSTYDVSKFVTTQPFSFTNESTLEFTVSSEVDGKEKIAAENTDDIEYLVELVDTDSKKVIGLYEKIGFSKNSLTEFEKQRYIIKGSGIGRKNVQVRVSIKTNKDLGYSISEVFRLSDDTLPKAKEKEVTFQGLMSVNDYQLAQNYPNPFNPSTMIKYQLPVNGHVTLKVYDVLGKEVATLINRKQDVGYYEVEFDGSGLASGMYIYKIDVQSADPSNHKNFSKVKKMLMIK